MNLLRLAPMVRNATVVASDTTPNAFTFTDQTDVGLSTVVTFNAITVDGITAPTSVSISGDASSEYRKNGGAWTNAPGTVVNGDTIQPRHNSSGSNSTAVNTVVTIGGVSDTATSTTLAASGDWQLPTGYYMPAKQAMIAIYPRPDGETSTNARHRWAYYDGTNSVQYRIPVGVAFGAPPFHYEVIDGPAGLNVGADYGDDDYGVVTWTPSGSVTNDTVTIRVTDQESNTLDFTWTVSTSSSTSRFMFIDGAGNNSNDGSIGSPKQTIAGVFGATYAASSNAGVNVYLRAGTYTPPAWTDTELNEPTLRFHSTNKPVSLMAFPGESVTLTMSATMLSVSPSGADTFMQGFTCDGHRSADWNYRLCMIGPAVRCTFDSIEWVNPGYGTAGDDNATMFYGPNPASFVNYLYIRNSGETGRSGMPGNSYGLCSLYTRKYVLIEGSYFSGSANAALYVKGTNEDVCVRYCNVNSSSGYVGSLGFSPLGDSKRIEFCYNKFKSANDSAFYPHEGGGAENVWIYRNSYYATAIEFAFPNTAGPYLIEQNAIMSNASPIVETGSQVTVSGAECHGNMSSGIMNSTTLLLQGSYLTNWRGRRGHEIWGG